ncbi:MAG: AMP-dependent synthetase and ligase [Hydrocarboniphaga sp.]|uniref:AMP-binding protein n=1 Tax=Hydrocarboniphaga sp. TaxID=2033016 RepID=UPI0026270617|nr:AMP-binding protein [Hydrocarboniphaga sp.]MDB5971671.1 AMP-dependent synthetase and ligase [Hydrocarboniphaga sp.]
MRPNLKIQLAGFQTDHPESVWIAGAQPNSGGIARAHLRSVGDVEVIGRYSYESLLPGKTIYECIRSAALGAPEKAAMIWLESADLTGAPREIRYRELMTLINQTANLLNSMSGGSLSVTAIILPMLPEGLIALWAAATAGVAVPINPFLSVGYVISILNAVKATVLVTTTSRYGDGAWDKLDEILRSVPSLKQVLLVDAPDSGNDFMKTVSQYPSELTFKPSTQAHDEAMYMPTGGTTGTPKLVRMSHWGQLVIAWNVGALMGARHSDVVAHGMPNFHCGGTISLGLRSMIFGQTLLTLTSQGYRDPEVVKNFWTIADRFRVTSLLATPTTAAAIFAAPDAHSARHCITDFHCGGSTVPQELVRKFHKRYGIWLRENWGMTELHGTTTGHPDTGFEPLIGSVGYSLPHYQTKAIEVDAANHFVHECAVGETGTLVIGGPSLMLGYADSRLDAEFFVGGMPDGARWGNTGDRGCVDGNGYVWVSGRTKDLIIRGGHNIDPSVIEEVLGEHEDVQVAAAVGRPDAMVGEIPVAYVVIRPGGEVTPEELIRFCREHMHERAAVPKEIIFIDAMPLTAVGKVSKPVLRIDAMRRVVTSVAEEACRDLCRFDVAIAESGTSPVAFVQLHDAADKEMLIGHLRDRLGEFHFKTVIEAA